MKNPMCTNGHARLGRWEVSGGWLCTRCTISEFYQKYVELIRGHDWADVLGCADELEAVTKGNRQARARAYDLRAAVARRNYDGPEVVRLNLIAASNPNYMWRIGALLEAGVWQAKTGDPVGAEATLWRAVDCSTKYRAACSIAALQDLANLGPGDRSRWWEAFRSCQARLAMTDEQLLLGENTSPIAAIRSMRELNRSQKDSTHHARRKRREARQRRRESASEA